MKRLLPLIFTLITFLIPPLSSAATIKAELQLATLKCFATSESDGDEIYVRITEVEGDNHYIFYRIPNGVETWPMSKDTKVSNISLWKGDLKDNQSKELNIALVEHDGELVNYDDLLGTVKVVLTNKKNKLEAEWDTPWVHDIPRARIEKGNEYHMYGDESHYMMMFNLIPGKK